MLQDRHPTQLSDNMKMFLNSLRRVFLVIDGEIYQWVKGVLIDREPMLVEDSY